MDPNQQIEFLEKVINFVKSGGGELALKTLDFSRNEFTVVVLTSKSKDLLTVEEKSLVVGGKPIVAIKSVRERTGCSLAHARDTVEKYRVEAGITEPWICESR